MPSFLSLRPADRPEVPRSTTKAEMPRRRAAGSVTAITTVSPARPACVVNVFVPSRTQSSPSARARVRRLPASLPASGSVSAQAPRYSPRASGDSQRSLCASDPNIPTCAAASPLWAATVSAIVGSTRASSSTQMQYSTAESPAPPYRAGNCMPSSPSSASCASSSAGNACASSQAMTCGAISRSANSRTARRVTCSASVGRKSMASRLYHAPDGRQRRPPTRHAAATPPNCR